MLCRVEKSGIDRYHEMETNFTEQLQGDEECPIPDTHISPPPCITVNSFQCGIGRADAMAFAKESADWVITVVWHASRVPPPQKWVLAEKRNEKACRPLSTR
jgi:hypothetical protein